MNRRAGLWPVVALSIISSLFTTQGIAQTTTRVEQTDPSITYEGNWQTIAHPHVSGGTIAISKTAGARVNIAFSGTGIAWIGYSCPCAGRARLYMDGVLQGERDAYAAAQEPQDLMYQFDNLTDGPHVLAIEVTGQRDSRANDAYIGVDAFDIGPQDPTLPTVTLTAPSDGAVVTGMLTLSAEASDNIGVAKVAFYADNYFLGEDRIAPYTVTVDTSPAPHGESFLVRAVAFDAVNSGQDTATVTVYQNGNTDVTPPFVEMSAPANNSLVTGLVTISAEGYDNVGITKVEFLANGTVIGEDTTAPYSITRDTSGIPSGGRYTLTARAYDAAGLSFTSTYGVNVIVQHEDQTRPTVSIVEPAAGSTVSGTTRVTANASDDHEVMSVAFTSTPRGRVAGTIVRTALYGAAFKAPFAVLLDTMGVYDGVYELEAQAMDSYYITGAAPRVPITIDNRIQPGLTRVDDAEPSIAYSGAWNTTSMGMESFNRSFHWGSVHTSSEVGATATFTFNGVGVRWLGVGCGGCAPTVALDGGAPQTVNFQYLGGGSQPVYESPTLAPGSHTLQITVQGNFASGNAVVLDGFEVLKLADTAAPTVRITAPEGGDLLSGTVVLEASAEDDAGVSKVQFYMFDTLLGEDTTAPWSMTLDTRNFPDAVPRLTAVAYDAVGHSTESSPVVYVNLWNNGYAQPVTVTAPAEGASVSGTITASALTSWPNAVSHVTFSAYNDNGNYATGSGQITAAPYNWSWDTTKVPNGSYTLYGWAALEDPQTASRQRYYYDAVHIVVNN